MRTETAAERGTASTAEAGAGKASGKPGTAETAEKSGDAGAGADADTEVSEAEDGREGSGSREGKIAVKSGFWYVVSNVLIRAVGIITAPIYTRLLTTSETGYANNFNNYVSIITVVTCLCLIYSVGRAKLDFREEFDAYMSSIQSLSSLFALLVLLGVILLCPEEGMLSMPRPLVILLFAYLALYPSIDYKQYKYRFEYRYRENIAVSVLITLSTVALSVALILLMPSDRGLAKILGTVIPSLLVAVWCYISILRAGRTVCRLKYWRYALAIGLPMIPHGLAMILLARIDTSMISRMCTFSEVGLYTSGYTIGTLLMFVSNAVGQAWLPWFNERLHEGNFEAVREKNLLLMAAGSALTLIFIAAAPEAVKLLFAKNYWEAMWVVPPVALGTLCQYFYTNYVNVELYYKKTVLIAFNSILAALVNIGLNYVFIRRYGYIAAAYTTLAGYFFLMILHFISTRFILKIKLYRDGAYFAMLLAATAAGMGIMALYGRVVLRYIILAALMAAVVITHREMIVRLWERFKRRGPG